MYKRQVDTIGQTLNQSVSTLISSVIMLGGVLIAMFVTRWEMALTALLTVPLGMLLMLLIVGKSQKYFIGQQNYLGELNGKIEETYAGQNVGAKKMDRVNTGILTSSIIGSVYSVVILGVMFLWSRQISLLFVDASETVILDQARQMLLINMVFYIPLTLVNVVRFTVQGMGFSKFAILAGVCEMIGRSVVAFFLVPYFGYTAVCFASPVAWILADLFLVPAYLYCAKTLRFLFEKNAQMM